MFPDNHQHPTGSQEPLGGVTVPGHSPHELGSPPLGVRPRNGSVEWTGMPIAAPDLDSHPRGAKNDVDRPPNFREGTAVDSKSQAATMQLPPERHFGQGVPTRLVLHPPSSRGIERGRCWPERWKLRHATGSYRGHVAVPSRKGTPAVVALGRGSRALSQSCGRLKPCTPHEPQANRAAAREEPSPKEHET